MPLRSGTAEAGMFSVLDQLVEIMPLFLVAAVLSADLIICPSCGYSGDDTKEWVVHFCPSYPERCAGCEIHENRLQCPECDHEWIRVTI